MNTISSLTAENIIPERISKDSLQVNGDVRIPVKSNALGVFGLMIYDEIQETIKSAFIIFAIITLCELTGLCDWWVQLVGGVS